MPSINTNTAALSALMYLNKNTTDQSDTLAKLASGSAITKASDDAAGLGIGTQLQSDVTVLDMISDTASQAVSILQVADGGLSNIADILQRMKALATESASGNVTDEERTSAIQTEFDQLVSEIDSIASSTRYSGDSLLDGAGAYASGVTFLIGTSSSDTITVTLDAATASALGVDSLDVSSMSGAQSAMDTLTDAITTLSEQRSTVGAYESRFTYVQQNVDTQSTNISSAASTIMDADVAEEKTNLSTYDTKTQAAVAALAQANKIPQEILSLLQS